MELQINNQSLNSRWLWKKLYLYILALYTSIGVIMLLPSWCSTTLQLPRPFALLLSFILVSFARALYEGVILYEAKLAQFLSSKLVFFALLNGGMMTALVYFIKPELGYFAIPLSMVISSVVVNALKNALWPARERTGFFALFPKKIKQMMSHVYRFYIIFVGLTILGYNHYGISFLLALSGAFFIAMLIEEFYNLTALYQMPIVAKTVVITVLWSALCAVSISALVWLLMQQLCYSGQAATIISVVIVKLLQPLGARTIISLEETRLTNKTI